MVLRLSDARLEWLPISDDLVRVLLVEDQTVFREALVVALEREPDVEVTGHVGSIAEARSCLSHTPVDVAVTEFGAAGWALHRVDPRSSPCAPTGASACPHGRRRSI